MTPGASDSGVGFVLEQVRKMVAAEGGSLELIFADETSLEVHYAPGVNEACPECVPTHEQVARFLNASLKVHAPHIVAVRVV
ncbi:MAG: NifU family protein [Gemmatimonadetes bacterium]|nr:NifU family protein [Gemmatimonadota bacterium]